MLCEKIICNSTVGQIELSPDVVSEFAESWKEVQELRERNTDNLSDALDALDELLAYRIFPLPDGREIEVDFTLAKTVDDVLACPEMVVVDPSDPPQLDNVTPDEAALALARLSAANDAASAHRRVALTTNEHLAVAAAIAALTSDPRSFHRGGQLVYVARGPSRRNRITSAGGPRIVIMPPAKLRTLLTEAADIVKECEDGDVPAHPPDWLVKGVHAAGEWPGIRHLEAVTESPLLRPDGTILQAAGYDAETGILHEPAIEYPRIADDLTRSDVEAARDALLEVVSDFPFATAAHRSAWLAGLLTLLSRFAYDGPAPLFLIDANVRAAGKGLLADTIALIATGRHFPRAAYTRDDDEMRKVITSVAIEGERLMLFDNVSGLLGNASLDAALTSMEWQGRILGKSEQPRLPLLVTWYATGNNVMLGADTARRVLHVRLESRDERPEERSDFRHVDLTAWIRQERPRLLAAALTILRAFCAAGRPAEGLKPWGSFEAWSALVRGCVTWLGLPDPAGTRVDLLEQADTEAQLLRALLAGWREIDPDNAGRSASEVFALLTERHNADAFQTLREAIDELPVRKGNKPAPRDLAYKLRSLRGRVVGGLCFDRTEDRNGVARWFVAGDAGNAGDVYPTGHQIKNTEYKNTPSENKNNDFLLCPPQH